MILINIATVIFCVSCMEEVFGASFSKVYVHSGSNGVPYQYATYGAPVSYQGSQLARLSVAPVGSVVPYPQVSNFVTSCVAPCVPAQQNAGLIAYRAPSAPVIVARDDPTAYEYSYAVYDENTGDQKWQKELSDGVVVRGQYSLVQPDGYVREVQYTADDATGFNAVVRKFLPGGEGKAIVVKKAEPCEPKSEAIKEEKKEPAPEPAAPAADPAAPAPEEPPAPAPEASAPAPEVTPAPAEVEPPKVKEPAPTDPPKAEKPREEAPAPPAEPAPVAAETSAEAQPAPTPAVVMEVVEAVPQVSAEVKEEPKPETVKLIPQQPQQTVVFANSLPAGYVSYSQLLKCIEAAKNAAQGQASPLAYILLPSKPC